MSRSTDKDAARTDAPVAPTGGNVIRKSGVALRTAWQAAPLMTSLSLLEAVAGGAAPTAAAWLTKVVLDGLTRPHAAWDRLAVPATALALAGLLSAALPQVSRYADAELGRRVSAFTQDRLFAAVNSFEGMSRFESPAFRDRLRLAQQGGYSAPPRLIAALLAAVQSLYAERGLDVRVLRTQGLLSLLSAVVAGGGLLWAVGQAMTGALTIGGVSVFVASIAGTQSALTTLISRVADSHQSLLVFGHYLDLVEAAPDLPTPAEPRPAAPLREGIELRGVWFRYDDDGPWILRGVDLFIPFGKAVALVGLNGAGKSTLVKLLCRFYDPSEGHILWDGVDIRDIAPADLRRRIGAVFQDHMNYDLTAAENIGIGDLDALGDEERVRTAARHAGIDEKLAGLPRGYDTMLSRIFYAGDEEDAETGATLSGGQWQRVALARALMRDQRDLLILDEPSSGLDAEAEHAVHERLRRYREGRTSLLISHRLGAVREADLIVVLSEGRILEEGDHAALLAAQGEYARLFALQAAGYRPEPQVAESAR